MFGKRLMLLLKSKGISIKQLQISLGVGNSTIQAWIEKNSVPSHKLIEISQLFGVSVDYLLGLSDSPILNDSKSDITSKKLQLLLQIQNIEISDTQVEILSENLNSHIIFSMFKDTEGK